MEQVLAALPVLADCPEAVGQVFNLGSTEEVTILDLARRVLQIVDQQSGELASVAAGNGHMSTPSDDRLVLVNLGRDLEWRPIAQPLAAPPAGTQWRPLWSSEDPRYGGLGTRPLDKQNWYLPGHATFVLSPEPRADS